MSELIKRAQVYSGFYTISLCIWHTDAGYEVSAARIYRTTYGGRIEGVKEWTFPTLDEAYKKANGYWLWLRRRGWLPVPDRT